MYALIVVDLIVGLIMLLIVMFEVCFGHRGRQSTGTVPAPAAGITNINSPPPEVVTGEVVKYQNWVSEEEVVDEEKGGGGGGGGGRREETKECSICLEEFKGEDECRVLTVCGHVYHKECIDLWLTDDNHCPLCRGSVRRGGRRLDGVDGNHHIDRI